MNNGNELAKQIKRANRDVYNRKSADDYNVNRSIFNDRRQQACDRMLSEAVRIAGDENYLDVGTGTGNLLRLAGNHFRNRFAVDISENMLASIRAEFQECALAASDADALPFPDSYFNCVSCYALLHHLYDHKRLFGECCRVLKAGGMLYTDHDPNYFFNRFYRNYYRLKYRDNPGFGTDEEELAEYHNTKSSGLNPEMLKAQLFDAGFSDVAIFYRLTDRSDWTGITGAAVTLLRFVSRVIPLKSFFTHFAIKAVK